MTTDTLTRRYRPTLALLFVLSVALSPVILRAQDEVDAAASPEARSHRLGPLFVVPVVALRDMGVDSNVYNATEDRISDFTFALQPAINATARVGRAAIALRSTTEYLYFAQQEHERSVNEDLGATVRVPLHRLTLSTGGTYLNTRDRPSEEIDLRSRRVERSAQAEAELRLTPKVTIGLLGRAAQTAFDADAVFGGVLLNDTLSNDTRMLTISGRYALTPLTSVVLTTEGTTSEFDRARIRDSDSRRTLLGVQLHPRALISGSANVGYQHFEPRDGVLPSFTGVVGFGNVMFRLTPSTSVGVSYDRNLYYSYAEDAPYYLRSGYGLDARRQVSGRWSVEIGASRYVHRYRRPEDLPVPAVVVPHEELIEGSVALSYQARPGTTFITRVAYRNRQGTSVDRGYDSVRVLSSVIYGF